MIWLLHCTIDDNANLEEDNSSEIQYSKFLLQDNMNNKPDMLETDEHITVYNTTTLQGLLKITDENLTMKAFTNQDPFSPPTDNIPNGQESFEETYQHAANESTKYDSILQESSTIDHNFFFKTTVPLSLFQILREISLYMIYLN